jgi:predicted RNase H-like HicB family nuclease
VPSVFFPAIMESEGGAYGVYFPDLPGCVAVGETATEAAKHAADALALHLEGLVQDGLPIPEPSDLAAVQADPSGLVAAKILVGAAEPTISERVNVWLPKILLERIDRRVAALGGGASRSGFLAQAARASLEAGGSRAESRLSRDFSAKLIAHSIPADSIYGGAGADLVAGGPGADRFVFASTSGHAPVSNLEFDRSLDADFSILLSEVNIVLSDFNADQTPAEQRFILVEKFGEQGVEGPPTEQSSSAPSRLVR